MGAATKIVIGFILLLIGLVLLIDSPRGVMPDLIPNNLLVFSGVDFGAIDWLGSLITIIEGFIPAFLILVGLFKVWLEADELKMQKELEQEETKEEKEEKEAKPEKKKK